MILSGRKKNYLTFKGTKIMTIDKNGKELKVGDTVKLLDYEYPWIITNINGIQISIEGGDDYVSTAIGRELIKIANP